MKQANALSIDQALKLIPDEFHPAIRRDGRKQIIETSKGMVAFHQSSTLKDGLWRTSHSENEIRNGIDYILFALGYDGILILSKEVLTSFFEDNYSSRYSNNRYPIHIFKESGRYYWKGKDGSSKDMTDCFYSNKDYAV